MDDAFKAKRKPARKSVIEASATTPMPVVIEADTAAPVIAAAPEPEPEPQPQPQPQPMLTAAPAPISARVDPVAPPAAVPATLAKDMTMDATTTTPNTAADLGTKSQAMFADVNTQAKGAMEKTAKMVEDMSAFNKGNLEAMVESSKIVARGLESLGQDAAAFAKAQFEQSTAAMKTLAAVKSPTEFMKVQSDMIRQSFDQMVAQSSRSTETMLKLAGEIAQPISNRVAIAADKMKMVAA